MNPNDSNYARFSFSAFGFALCICLLDHADGNGIVYPSLLKQTEDPEVWEEIGVCGPLSLAHQSIHTPFDTLVGIVDIFNPI